MLERPMAAITTGSEEEPAFPVQDNPAVGNGGLAHMDVLSVSWTGNAGSD